MEPARTQAEKIGDQLGLPRHAHSPEDAAELRNMCVQHKGRLEYSNREYGHVNPDDPDFEATGGSGIYYRLVSGSPYAHVRGDPIRYRFTDGSAIVVHGETWSVEGREPFAVTGAEQAR